MRLSRWLSSALALSATAAVAGQNVDVSVGGHFKGEIRYDDQKIEKHNGTTPKAALTNHTWSHAVLKAKVNDTVSYAGDFAFLSDNAAGLGVKYSYVTLDHGMVDTSIGYLKRSIGGWDVADSDAVLGVDGSLANPLVDALTTTPGFSVAYDGGMWSLALQFSKDMQGPWANMNVGASKTPAAALDFRGDFGGVKPILQIGLLDGEHSRYLSAGVKGEVAALGYEVDVTGFEFAHKVVSTSDADKNESKKDTTLSYRIKATYDVGMLAPFFVYSALSTKQHTTDVKANPYVMVGTTRTYNYSDNGSMISVGSTFDCFGDNVSPYVAVDMSKGKFITDAAAGKEEDLSNMTLRTGLTAQF
jgi:hypothetical protein